MSIRLYVGNLPKELDRKELEVLFAEEFGDLVSTKVITDRKTGKCRGFGFVTVKTSEEADQVIEKFNGYVFKDSALKIEKALPRSKGKEEEPKAASNVESDTSSSAPRTSRKGKSQRSGPSQGTSQSDAVQPDPRWAQELEKLKQLLATQASNSQAKLPQVADYLKQQRAAQLAFYQLCEAGLVLLILYRFKSKTGQYDTFQIKISPDDNRSVPESPISPGQKPPIY